MTGAEPAIAARTTPRRVERTPFGVAVPGVSGPVEPRRARARRWRWPAVVALGLVLALAATLAAGRPGSRIPLAPDNPGPDGARAAAEILRREGVEITVRRTTAGALEATPAGSTLVVTDPAMLGDEQWASLAGSGLDLVLTDVAFTDLGAVTDALVTTGAGGDGLRRADCGDPDARAAGSLTTGSGDVRAAGAGVVVCFPPPEGAGPAGETGAYAVVEEDGRRLTVLANPRPLTNAALAEAGNAALVLRMLGRTDHLTWYIPSVTDTGTGPVPSTLPPGAGAVGAWALLVAGAVALWQGRRLGPLVVEPLPVVVPPAETTRGRARLYRRARAHAHAGAALRAGTASRLARRLGVPGSAGRDELLAALVRATGRPAADLDPLLYGPLPKDDPTLLALIRALDALESEVAR